MSRVETSMEAVVYEDAPDASARLKRLKVAMLAFAGVPATIPAVTAILVPVELLAAPSSSSGLRPATLARETAESRLRQVCADRVQIRRWLQHELGITMDVWVVVTVLPRDINELSLLANWQMDRHRSPLRQADALSLSLQEVVLLWGDGRCQAPMLEKFLLPHQSLLLDVTCCIGESGRQLVNPAVFSPIRAKQIAKGRTCVVAFYSAWLPLSFSTRGLAQLQQQFRDIARHVLLHMKLPLSCPYGGEVGALQQNLVNVTLTRRNRVAEEGSEQRLAAALLATRSLKDIYSLVGVLFGNPLANYYGEAMAFCTSVQRRRRAAGFFCYPASVVLAKPAGTTGAMRHVDDVSPAEPHRKRGRKETATEAVDEGLTWCEDTGV
ncbi:hypothetical protein TcYC6_0126570 [Trypanosoma cruzi]|nr:hypothetical protein TcYC6_0126570 [Trypanosoma cruzi]